VAPAPKQPVQIPQGAVACATCPAGWYMPNYNQSYPVTYRYGYSAPMYEAPRPGVFGWFRERRAARRSGGGFRLFGGGCAGGCG
jgi:hypothetical protein